MAGQLSSIRQCDILIRDKEIRDENHPTLIIGSSASSDLLKPFSKAQLLHALSQKLDAVQPDAKMKREEPDVKSEERVGFEILERHIEKLTREYQENILKAIRAFYEK